MQIIPKKYFIIILASILVIGFGLMSLYLNKKKANQYPTDDYNKEMMKIETQSESDETKAIEKDLIETDLDSVDKELEDMEAELEEINY